MITSQASLKIAAGMTLLTLGIGAGARQGKVSYWPFKVGSTWTLTTHAGKQTFDQVVTVTSVSNGIATLEYKANGKAIQGEKYRFDANQVVRLASGPNAANVINPPVPIIKYPLKAGDKWDWKGEINQSGVVTHGSGTLSVSGPESVKTPAGVFQAMKVHFPITVEAQKQKITIPNDYWFAPNVGLIKQSLAFNGVTISGELKSYKLK